MPPIAARRAGPAHPVGVAIAAAAPAQAVALAPKTQGNSSRASLHTGIAVFASSAPVYVARGGALTNQTPSARSCKGLNSRRRSSAAAVVDAPPERTRI